ncbi:hypothetical protein FSP39_013889 [Pinctada imbricata]|uniref:Uncharacterized protein n=1 Tax=Pinctada imbricata TaxID=66713 RepID=A0AA89BVM8_PINIB|nr:hypothetical protein FSP39_013889 [Pinctada imbricata]
MSVTAMAAIHDCGFEVKETTETNNSASYLDIMLSYDTDGHMNTSLYDKRDDFNFSITNFPFLSSNIPSSPAYGVFISQLIRYARASTKYTDFVLRARRLSDKLLSQGYVCDRLTSSLRKFYGRYEELVIHYDVPLSRMVDGYEHKPTLKDESQLIEDLTRNYNPIVRPINATNSINVIALGLSMIDIAELHEKEEIFETGAFLQHLWSDPRLKWEPSKYGGLTDVHIPASLIWKPDITLINNADTVMEKVEPLVIIFHLGTVFYSPQYRLRAPCQMDLSKFPFDEQNCFLLFGSWTYDNSRINLTHFVNGKKGLDMKDFRMNKEWKVLETQTTRIDKHYEMGNNKVPLIKYEFKLKRNSVYYTHVFILPSVLLAVLVPFQFMLPPDSKERISLGATLLLSLIFLLSMLQEFLPEAHPNVPTLASYYTVTMIWITLSLLASIWIINIQSRGPRRQKVPVFIRHFFLRGLKRLVCLGEDTYYPLDEMETISMRGLDRAVDGNVRQQTEITSQNKLERDVEEILRHVHTLTLRSTVIEARHEIRNEWHQVALVLDRLLCFLFAMTFLLYTFVLLA